jgi:hypothetical protein
MTTEAGWTSPTRTSAASAAPATPEAPRRRRDAGTVRVGERDLVGLRWCAEQGAMRLDQLAALFTALDGRAVSADAARKTITRWLDHGMAQGCVVLAGEPAYYWTTLRGMRLVGLDYPAVPPGLATLAHTLLVNDVRLEALRRYPDARWRSERDIKSVLPARRRGELVPHLPDAELHMNDGRIIALEVERTPKTIERVRTIQLGLLSRRYDYDRSTASPLQATPRYSGVWYFTTPTTDALVRAAAAQLPADFQPRLHIMAAP